MNSKTKRVTTIGMLCAITYVTMVVGRIPIILFLKYDPSDVIVTLGGFIWGPMTSCIVSVIVATLEMITVSDTGILGCIMNIVQTLSGNVKKCAVGKHPKSEKHGNTAQFSEVERSGTQENCGGIGSGCRLRLRPLPVLRRRQSQRVARIDPNAVVVDKNIAENDRFDLFSR